MKISLTACQMSMSAHCEIHTEKETVNIEDTEHSHNTINAKIVAIDFSHGNIKKVDISTAFHLLQIKYLVSEENIMSCKLSFLYEEIAYQYLQFSANFMLFSRTGGVSQPTKVSLKQKVHFPKIQVEARVIKLMRYPGRAIHFFPHKNLPVMISNATCLC